MTDAPIDLEDGIRAALHERAASVNPTARDRRAPDPVRPIRPLRRVVVAATVVAVAAASAVVLTNQRAGNDSPRDPVDQIIDGRMEVPLHEVPVTDEVRAELMTGPGGPGTTDFDFGPDTDPIALRPGKALGFVVVARYTESPPPVEPGGTFTSECAALIDPRGSPSATSFGCGYSESHPSTPDPEVARSGLQDLGDLEPGDGYYAWTRVPVNATTVTFDAASSHAWQTPIQQVAVFVGPSGARPALRAYSADGRLLAEQRIPTPESPMPTPRSGGSPLWPPWYDLDAQLAWCDTAPLEQLMLAGGALLNQRAVDPASGQVFEARARVGCREWFEILPKPGGSMTASFSIRDGSIHATYFEDTSTIADGIEIHSSGREIPEAEAQARIATDRIEATQFCTSHPKQITRRPECRPGG